MSSNQKIASSILSFIIIWLLILMIPDQRPWVIRQITFYQPSNQTSAFPSDAAIAKVLSRLPDNPNILAFQIEKKFDSALRKRIDPNNSENDDQYFLTIKDCINQYDELIKRFPHERWMIQSRLRLTLAGLDIHNFDFGTVFSDQPRKNRQINSYTLTDADLKKGILLAKKGATYDPRNSFYNWTEAALFFGLRQNENALKSLQQGVAKPEYDDGILLESQRRAGILKLAGMNSWEDFARMWQATLYTDGASFFTTNWVTWATVRQGAKAEEEGNNQRALDIYGAQMKLVDNLYKRPVYYDMYSMHKILLRQIWAAQNRKQTNPKDKPGKVLTQKEMQQRNLDFIWIPAKRFAAYAKEHGRTDLAQEALQLAQQYKTIDPPYPYTHSAPNLIGGLPTEKAEQLGKAYWAQSQILYIVLLCAILAVAMFGVLAVEKKLDPQSKTDEIQLQTIDVITGVIFAIAAVAVYLYLTLNSSGSQEAIFVKNTLFNFYPYDIRDSAGFLSGLSIWGPIFLVFLFVVWCRLSAMWRTRKIVYPERGNFGGILFKWGRTVGSLLVILLLLLWMLLAQLTLPWRGGVAALVGIIPVMLYLAFMIAHKVIVIYLNLPIYRQRLRYFHEWLPRLLGAIAVTGSLIYLILALNVLNPHQNARANILDMFKNGEAHQLKVIGQSQKPPG